LRMHSHELAKVRFDLHRGMIAILKKRLGG
jgi:hypothetical protein